MNNRKNILATSRLEFDHLKELNEYNTELYVNGNKRKIEKYFIPEKEGEYIIELRFNIKLTDCSYNVFRM